MTPKRGDAVQDCRGKIKCMAVADGYVMCRRPRAVPFVMTVQNWSDLHFAEPGTLEMTTNGLRLVSDSGFW